MPASRIYNPFVGAGGAGPSPSPTTEEVQTIGFSFTDTPVKAIFTIPANSLVISVIVAVKTVFDDSSAVISVGDSTVNDRLFKTTNADLSSLGSYQAVDEYFYVGSSAISLYLNVGTSTQGAGYVTILYNTN